MHIQMSTGHVGDVWHLKLHVEILQVRTSFKCHETKYMDISLADLPQALPNSLGILIHCSYFPSQNTKRFVPSSTGAYNVPLTSAKWMCLLRHPRSGPPAGSKEQRRTKPGTGQEGSSPGSSSRSQESCETGCPTCYRHVCGGLEAPGAERTRRDRDGGGKAASGRARGPARCAARAEPGARAPASPALLCSRAAPASLSLVRRHCLEGLTSGERRRSCSQASTALWPKALYKD